MELDCLGEKQLTSLTAYRYQAGLDAMNRRKNQIIESAALSDDAQAEGERDLGSA